MSNKSQLGKSEDYELDFITYEKSKYEKVNEEYMSGKKLINLHATGVLFACAASAIEEINRDLFEIV